MDFYDVSDKKRKYSTEEEWLMRLIGKNIKNLREAKNWSQHKLSVEALIPKNQVGRIERAEINTTVVSLYRISAALEVDIQNLLRDTNK